MSWYQENKFAATLLGVTVVVSGALVYLGMGAGSDADAAKQREQAAVSKINNLQSAKPYPSVENEQLLAEGLATFAEDTKKFQDKMLKFRPAEMETLTANQFSGKVSNYHNKLKAYYQTKKVAVPAKGDVFFGMEKYAKIMASEESTSFLNYQREGLEWLFTNLADSGINSLNNVYRAPVAEALASAPKEADKSKGKKAKKSNKTTEITSVYEGLPIEITFTGSEDSLQKFITEVTASEEYFFAIKLLKIRNEEQEPVTISKATFAPPVAAPAEGADALGPKTDDGGAGGLDLGAGFDLGGDDFAVEEDKEIIKQVIGDEKITVFMQLELVLFKEASSVAIPRLVKEKPAAADKDSSKKVTIK